MSMGGEMMEQMYDERIRAFLQKLEQIPCGEPDESKLLKKIIDNYREHFKNFGIYGESKTKD